MGFNSPIPVRLQDETRKATKIIKSFVDTSNNGLDKVIPRSVLERAAGFVIFTVVKAGFVFSARAGSGVVIARLPDGSPSAIGLGGFGFGGQMGAEVTDFMIVLNSRSAVKSFMAAGSLTLGGNLSVAVGPLGRNAEGSGALNTKGKVAAMYSYSKTKGLFGGVSVEGSIILERQDANRLAYGSSVSSKQILLGEVESPEWAYALTHELDHCTGLPGGQKWQAADEDGEGGAMGYEPQGYDSGAPWNTGPGQDRERDPDKVKGGRSRGSSLGQGYLFGDGIGPGGGRSSPSSPGTGGENSPVKAGRRRAGTLLDAVTSGAGSALDRPTAKRASSFLSFGGGNGSSSSPKKGQPLNSPSSENYNAGLTWDSDGPMSSTSYATRSRSGSSALRPPSALSGTPYQSRGNAAGPGAGNGGSPFDEPSSRFGDDGGLLDDGHTDLMGGYESPSRGSRGKYSGDDRDLLGSMALDEDRDRLTGSLARMNMASGSGSASGPSSILASAYAYASPTKGRSRSNSKTTTQKGKTFEGIPEDDAFYGGAGNRDGNDNGFVGFSGSTSRGGQGTGQSRVSPFGADDDIAALAARSYGKAPPPPIPRGQGSPSHNHTNSSSSSSVSPSRSRSQSQNQVQNGGGGGAGYDNYPRAMALFDFHPTDPGDLGLKKGQVVVVLDKVGAAGEWWRGVLAEGEEGASSGRKAREGIFPNNYVEVVGMPKDLRGGVGRGELRARMLGNEFD